MCVTVTARNLFLLVDTKIIGSIFSFRRRIKLYEKKVNNWNLSTSFKLFTLFLIIKFLK